MTCTTCKCLRCGEARPDWDDFCTECHAALELEWLRVLREARADALVR